MRAMYTLRAAMALAAIGLGGCGAAAERPGSAGDTEVTPAPLVARCVDEDRDGFGPNCVRGADCDDQDPGVTDQCYRCLQPAEGCMCAEGTHPRACDVATGREVTPLTCWIGQRNCVHESWTRCLIYAPPFQAN